LRFARLIDFVWLYIQTDQSVSGALIKREFDESVVNFLDHKKKSDMWKQLEGLLSESENEWRCKGNYCVYEKK